MGVVLNFHLHGTCAEALELYSAAFGTKPDILLRNSDANPADQMAVPENRRNRVYHAEMKIGGLRSFFSDEPDDRMPAPGALSAVVTFDGPDEVVRAFRVLKGGATIVHPMRMTTYSACFVSLVDRFGVRWELMTETPPPYRIRFAGVEDARAVAEVLAHTWGEAYGGLLAPEVLARQTDVEVRLEKVAAHIGEPDHVTLVMERAGIVCGMAGLHPCADDGRAIEVEALYVRASEWGKGAGRHLMEHALAAARERGYEKARLWVLKENVRARVFYERCGFSLTGEEAELPLKAADGVQNAVEVRCALTL
jgi:PhnB protein